MSERAALTKTAENKGKNTAVAKQKENFYESMDSPVEQIFHLQRTIGNQAVQRLIKSGTIQAKLKIGQPNDKYEMEADRVAEKVMRMPEPKQSSVNSHWSLGKQVTPLIQKQELPEEEEEKNQEEEEEQIQTKPIGDQVMRVPETSCPECNEEKKEEPIQTKPIAHQITPLVQRQVGSEEEEEPLQTKLLHRQETEEEEEEPIQTKLMQNDQLHRQKGEPEEEEKETVQRQEQKPEKEKDELGNLQPKGNTGSSPNVTPSIASNISSLKGGGQPLTASTRSFFESRFGADFSHVRVHTDSKAAETASSINAKAFTKGRDVVFNSGQYSPGTSSGKRLLAHELTHVVQQGERELSITPIITISS
jgi:hypothetical protein